MNTNKLITSKIIYKEIINYCFKEKGKWNSCKNLTLSLVCQQWFLLIKKIINSFLVVDLKSLIYLEKRLITIYKQQEGQKRLDYHNKYFTSSNLIFDNSRNDNYYSLLNCCTEIKFKNLDQSMDQLIEQSGGLDNYTKLIKSVLEYTTKIGSIVGLKFSKSDRFYLDFKPYSPTLNFLSIKSSNKITFPLNCIGDTVSNSPNLKSISLFSFCYCSNPLEFLNALFKSNVENFNLKIEYNGSLLIDRLLEKNFASFKVSGAKLFLSRFNQLVNSPVIEYLDSPIHILDNEPLENLTQFCENIQNSKTILKLSISGDKIIDQPQPQPEDHPQIIQPILTMSNLFSTVFYYNNTVQSLCISRLQILTPNFFESLKSNTSITNLELTDGTLNQVLLQCLSNLLMTNYNSVDNVCCIKYLSIRNNGLTDENSLISNMLMVNKSIKGIDLSKNEFSIGNQTRKIFESLSLNDYIYKIDYSDCCKFQTKESIKPLYDYINKSKSLIAINLYNCLLFNKQSTTEQLNEQKEEQQEQQKEKEEEEENQIENNEIILFSKKFDYKTFFIV